ncbi:MAG: O-antigen ligase domain-containing protein [Hyphomicrobiales bacterium]|nr:O-antigen ligase domain-containing protein [Hyphomicrobiales bacterium]
MATTAAYGRSVSGAPPRAAADLKRAIERGLLFLLTASSFIAFVEPSPYELIFAGVLAFFLATGGLRVRPSILPLAFCLIVFSIGGFISLAPFLDESESVMFTLVSAYLSLTSLFFAMLLRIDAPGRIEALRNGYVIAGVAASIAGIIGFFNIGGLGEILTRYDRAAGTFKDPNVLGTFVILPLVYLVHSILTTRLRVWSVAAVAIIVFGGVFLSFSRGAWGHAFGSLALMTVLTFIANREARVRRRIIVMTMVGLTSITGAFAAVLSLNSVERTFENRATFEQSYDLGEQGRFGNQLASIPMLMERPNGFGPLRFRFFFAEDAHNVYINAFASYGWLGGFSYLVLIILTMSIGWRLVCADFSLRGHAIVIWSTLFVEILQGFQIDTDHWRHFWLMLGLIWGMLPVLRSALLPLAPGRHLS